METNSMPWSELRLFAALLGAALLAGLLGGVLNFCLTYGRDDEDSSLWKSIFLGVGASFLVPLFLNTISSNLVLEIQTKSEHTKNMLVFFGFCLVAAISSKAFIQTMSKRVLDEARAAKRAATAANKKAAEVQSDLQPIIAKEMEPTEPETASAIVGTLPTLNDQEWRVLEALANGEKVLRTRTSLARETGIPKSDVDRIVDALQEKKLVATQEMKKSDGSRMRRRYITAEGRTIVSAHSAAARAAK